MNLFLKYAAFAAVATSVTLASCNDDGDDPVAQVNRDPTLTIVDSTGANVDGGVIDAIATEFTPLTITTGDPDGNLKSIAFQTDGVKSDRDDIRRGNLTSSIESDILLITGDDTNGKEDTYFFRAPAQENDSLTYTITVADEDGLEATQDVTIYSAVALTSTETVLLANADGQGLGGLNLATRKGVPAADTSAGIVDVGIDNAKPAATNWLQQIAPANGAVLHIVSESYLTESGLDYESLRTRSQIRAAFESTSDDVPRSDKVEAGDVFVVLKDDVYYYLDVESVDVDLEENNDQYVFNVKF